jgi:hypothetical protein
MMSAAAPSDEQKQHVFSFFALGTVILIIDRGRVSASLKFTADCLLTPLLRLPLRFGLFSFTPIASSSSSFYCKKNAV